MNIRLSPFEAIIWRAGQDATLRLNVGALFLLDRAPKYEELVERVRAVVEQAPRLHWLPDDPTFSRIRPVWVEEVTPDVENHVRSAEVAPPGSIRQVLDLITLLEVVPFDPERSPWDVTLVHGFGADRAALYLRAHHVLTDGIGGVGLVEGLLDHPDGRTPVPTPRANRRNWSEGASDDSDTGVARRPGTITIDVGRVVRSWSAGIDVARDVQPLETVVRGFQRGLDLANSVSRQVIVTGGPLSPSPPAHSMLSRFDVVSVDDARHTACALGGSRNDLLVVAAAAALGLYYERSGKSCPKVRVAMPARRTRDGTSGGNWFAPARLEVPATPDRPQRQFGIVSERLTQARHEPALRYTASLASAISRLPNRVLLPAFHAQADSIDLAVTALPGLHGEPRVCGAKVHAAYPLGPRLGIPLNITAFGNNGGLDVGVALDPAAITDPDGFRECLIEMFARLVPAGVTQATDTA